MQDDEFEWDDDKARINLADRGIDFMDVRPIFGDLEAIDEIDDREDYGEERTLRLGLVNGRVLAVCYTERGDRIRIISARKAEKREQVRYLRERGQ